MVAGSRVELDFLAYEASVTPVHFPATVEERGVEPRLSACKAEVLPLSLFPPNSGRCAGPKVGPAAALVEYVGLEPTAFCLPDRRSS